MHHCPEMVLSKPSRIILEFTSRCNLQCAYCQNAFAEHRANGCDIDDQVLSKAIDYILQNNVEIVCVNGHGETTIYKDWHLHCNRMLEKGIRLGIITNLAKKYSSEEIDSLSRFATIEASCDTSDPELFAFLRKGNTLERFMDNMKLIRQRAVNDNRPAPLFVWSCVVTDKNVWGLCEYIHFGVTHGIKNFNFCNYTQLPDIKDRQVPKHIADLPFESFLQAAYIIRETKARFSVVGIDININGGLVDRINNRIDNEKSRSGDFQQTDNSNSLVESIPEEMTRDCQDPWHTAFVLHTGEVRPCCVGAAVGKIDKNTGLDEIYNGENIKTLRQKLLSGKLTRACNNCPTAGLINIDLFKDHITEVIAKVP